MKKSFNPRYISDAQKRIWKILNDIEADNDLTRATLSIKDAVQAAANVWGVHSDKEIHHINQFIREISYLAYQNIKCDKEEKINEQNR